MLKLCRLLALPLTTLILAVGCGSSVDPGPKFDPTQLPEGTAVEPWGIGDQWYDYDFTSHRVTPRKRSWVIVPADGDAYFLQVTGYYGKEGESGVPRMEIRRWDGTTFGAPQQWESSARIVGDTRVCLRFESGEETSCEGDYDLIWRTDRRPVPEMGFSIPNPGFYIQRREGLRVYQFENTQPPASLPTGATDEITQIRSIFDTDAKPLLALSLITPEKSIFHLVASLQIAEWQTVINADATEIQIRARCVDAAVTHQKTALLDMAPAELTLTLDELDTWTFIDLCGGSRNTEQQDLPPLRISHSANDLRVGQWPSNQSFGIALQQTEEDIRLWVSPDQPIEVRTTNAFETTAAPTGLWSIP